MYRPGSGNSAIQDYGARAESISAQTVTNQFGPFLSDQDFSEIGKTLDELKHLAVHSHVKGAANALLCVPNFPDSIGFSIEAPASGFWLSVG
jgi:hypothetical protein